MSDQIDNQEDLLEEKANRKLNGKCLSCKRLARAYQP